MNNCEALKTSLAKIPSRLSDDETNRRLMDLEITSWHIKQCSLQESYELWREVERICAEGKAFNSCPSYSLSEGMLGHPYPLLEDALLNSQMEKFLWCVGGLIPVLRSIFLDPLNDRLSTRLNTGLKAALFLVGAFFVLDNAIHMVLHQPSYTQRVFS